MNEGETIDYSDSRSEAKAQFASKLGRYRDLLLRKWWVLAVGVTLGFATWLAISLFSPPCYVSVGRMIVSIKLSIPEGSVYAEEMSSFLGTQAALMQSGVVVSRAQARVMAENPTFTNQPVQLKVIVSPRTSIFVLEATGQDRRYAQAFLQCCMDEYISFKREMRARTSDTTVAGLTEEVLKLEKDLRKGEEGLAEFQKSNSVVLLQEQGNSAGNYLLALNQQLARLKSEYDLLQMLTFDQNFERRQETASIFPKPTESPQPPGTADIDRQDVDYLKAKQQILLMKADREDLGRSLRPKHPKMIAMTEEIARRERLLDIYLKQSVDQLENHKSSLALQIQNLQKDTREWEARTLDISRRSADYQRLKANVQRVQTLYDRLLATMQALDVNKEISPESVTVMEPASPAFAAKPQSLRRLLTAGAISLALSIVLLLFLDHLDDRITSFSELQELFDEPVLVQVPRQKGVSTEPHLKLVERDDERHSLVEAYRNLRSSLLYMTEGNERPRTMLLTSSIPNEGKSLTAANLAITLAKANARVLLIDADLRKGVLHGRFGLKPEAGLCEVLMTGCNWEQLVLPTRYENVSLLPRGGVTNQSSELFIGERTQQVLKEAAAKYDFVVIDTAPVMAADDVTSLAPHADAVLFVLRAEHTSGRVARAALELLYQRHVRVLGIVFNAVRRSSADYYYYHKYKNYYVSYPSNDRSQRGNEGATAQA